MPPSDFLSVYAPLCGAIVPLDQVPDPIFAEKMLGDGISIDPQENAVYSPFDGVIKTLHKALHAVVIESQGVEILIHIGVETVNLKGQGFKAFVQCGQTVKKGDKLIEFDKEYISKNAPSSLIIVLVANMPDIPVTSLAAGSVQRGELLYKVPPARRQSDIVKQDDEDVFTSPIIEIKNKNGLHARPASIISKIAAGCKECVVKIIKGTQQADAKSMVEILGLSIDYGDKIQIYAVGPKAREITQEIASAVLSGLNEGVVSADVSISKTGEEDFDFTKEAKLKGQGIFPSVVIGRAHILQRQEADIKENSSDASGQSLAFDAALEKVKKTLREEEQNAAAQSKRAQIISAHLGMLEDPFLLTSARELIAQNKTAAFAWRAAVNKSINVLNSTGNKLLKERAADYEDICLRVVMELTGKTSDKTVFEENSVVIVNELLPYELSLFDKNVAGVIMAEGSSTAHISIMLKNLGIPSIICAGAAVLKIPNGAPLVMDSQTGDITVNPQNIEELKEKKKEADVRRAENKEHCFEPAVTKDGVRILVKGNVGSVQEARLCAENGSEGISLVRTEFLFAGAEQAPSEEEQYKIYSEIASSQKGQSVIIRTLDVGGDKPLSYFPLPKEENPIMGLRGVRNYKLREDIFRAQVRAIMRVEPYGTAKIMLPMVAFLQEFFNAKKIIEEEQQKLGIDKVSVGIMVEVPSAALMAEQFANYADFFSLGTNDLTQYALAIDRGQSALSSLSDSLNPSVLSLISSTIKGAQAHEKPVGICGAMASDLASVVILVGLGIKELGVVTSLIPDVKAFVRTLDSSLCRQYTQSALLMRGAGEVRDIIKKEFGL